MLTPEEKKESVQIMIGLDEYVKTLQLSGVHPADLAAAMAWIYCDIIARYFHETPKAELRQLCHNILDDAIDRQLSRRS